MAVVFGVALWCGCAFFGNTSAIAQTLPIVTLELSSAEVEVGETVALIVTIDNQANTGGTSLSFSSSDIADVTPISTSASCGGSGSNRAWVGDHFEVTGDFLQGGRSCQESATFSVSEPGVQTITIDDFTTSFGVNPPVSVELTVVAAPVFVEPDVAIVFSAPTAQVGEPVHLTVTIDNSANTTDSTYSLLSSPVSDLVFGHIATVASTCDVGPNPWRNLTFDISNRTLSAGQICTVEVELRFRTTSSQSVNVTLTSPDHDDVSAGPAKVEIAAAPSPALSMEFAPNTLRAGQETTLTITVGNSAFVSSLFSFSTSGFENVASNQISTDCGGGGYAGGSSGISVSNRTVPARSSCSFELLLIFDEPGDQEISINDFTSSTGTADPVPAKARITPAILPTMSIEAVTNPVALGEFTSVVLTIDNTANAIAATNMSFSIRSISGAVVEPVGSTCGGDQFNANPGSFSASQRSVPAGADCTFTLGYAFSEPGSFDVDVLSFDVQLGEVSGGDTPPLFAINAVLGEGPVLGLDFDPDPVEVSQPTQMTISIDNSGNPFAISDLEVVTSPVPGASVELVGSTCLGGGGYVINDGSIALPDRSVDAGGTCTLLVEYVFAAQGVVEVNADAMSDFGPSVQASTTATVEPGPGLTLTSTFDRESVPLSELARLTITFDNRDNPLQASITELVTSPVPGAELSDIESNCPGGGHTIDDGSLGWSDRFILPESICTLSFNYEFADPGDVVVRTDVALEFAAPLSTSSSILVQPVTLPVSFAIAQNPVQVGERSDVTITIDNTANNLPATNMTFATRRLTGAVVEYVGSTCGGDDYEIDSGQFSTSGRSVPAGSSCTFSLLYAFPETSSYALEIVNMIWRIGEVLDGSDSPPASIEVVDGTGPTVRLGFETASATVQETTELTITVDNRGNPFEVREIDLVTTPVTEAEIDNVRSTCAGNSGFQVNDGSVILANRIAFADAVCTISIDYAFAEAGAVTISVEGDSAFGPSATATTSLVVLPSEVPSAAVCDGKQVTIDMTAGASGMGTPNDDVILGTSGDDVIDAGDGDDTVCAGDGDDVVIGGNGDDTLIGGDGSDIMRGNAGVDLLDGQEGNDRLLGGIHDDILIGGDGDDYLGGFGGADLIFGGPGNEVIFGGFGADRINAGPGNDEVHGLIGDDVIDGGDGNDHLDGDRGNDTINGDAGNDVIRGGNANDVLDGGAGDDSVNGGRADDQLSGGAGTNDTCVGNKETTADSADSTCETIFGVP